MGQIKIMFWFDVEDFINSESETALLGLLDILDERGIVGIFKFVGEKIRVIERNGRTDILEKLKRHEIGYHTDWHSVHPVVTEYLEPLGFRNGAQMFIEREGDGFRDLQRITGQSVHCYGQPGQAWAPQPFPVLRHWGVTSYLDGHDQVSMDGKPFWYGGMLNLSSLTGIMHIPLEEDALEKAKRRFDQLCEQQSEEPVGFISLFYHPTEFVFSEFWDAVNFSRENNPPPEQWVKPRFRPEGDMRKYLDRVGEFIDYTLSKPNVSYVSTEEVRELERSEFRVLSGEEVIRFAQRTRESAVYLNEGRLNLAASELFWLYRQYILGLELVPELLYGPEIDYPDDPLPAGAGSIVPVQAVLKALQAPMPDVCGYKQLPDYYELAGLKVSPATMMCTLAAIIRGGLGAADNVQLVSGTLGSARHAGNEGEWAKWWVIFPKGMDVSNIIEMSRRQTWTLKPALFN